MLPYKSMIKLNHKCSTPIYVQISNALIKQILQGAIKPGLKLPGSRSLSQQLSVHRNTIIKSYEELQAQGWLNSVPAKGNFVVENLPIAKARKIKENAHFNSPLLKSSFSLAQNSEIPKTYDIHKFGNFQMFIDDGCPDVRLAPIEALGRHYRSGFKHKTRSKLDYTWQISGYPLLKSELKKYLSETRGINVETDNILITRGSMMGFYLFFKNLLRPGDIVALGRNNYQSVNKIVEHFGGEIAPIPVDDEGLDVDALEAVCQKKKIRAVYIIPHHHHPTTVSLSGNRRMRLLMLAKKHRFAVLEDDYDFDFHYKSSPILPLMSIDTSGSVVYTGSFSKCLVPAFRIGYIVAPKNVIQHLTYTRRFIDRQGDILMERALGLMMQEGELRRFLRKALLIYKDRRDHFCDLLQSELGDQVYFNRPEGGLAVWVEFKPTSNYKNLSKRAAAKGLYIGSPEQSLEQSGILGIRMGFASISRAEAISVVKILKGLLIH